MKKIDATLIILDDDPDVLLSAKFYLSQFFERVFAFSKTIQLMPAVHEHNPDAILLDMNYHKGRNDGEQGLHLLAELKKVSQAEVVVMTAYGEIGLAVEAIKRGAFDFVVKPWSNEKLHATMNAAVNLSKSNRDNRALKRAQAVWQMQSDEHELLGESEAIKGLKSTIDQVAKTDANILILGENGTGKEVIANLIHKSSQRSDKPFVKIDLGAIHENLFESELFGAVKGAYTDLKKNKEGRIALAKEGTVFLDEIGNLSLTNQAKLLSFLQNRQFVPVGASQAVRANVRIVSATNANINKMVAEGNFRQDLLYRINTIEMLIPPLRERIEDIPVLMQKFIKEYGKHYAKPNIQLAGHTISHILNYPWPGNVRELKHAIERAVILNQTGKLTAKEIVPSHKLQNSKKTPLRLDELEKQHILTALERNAGNISKAAKDLGLTRAALYRRIEKYGL